MMFQSKVRYIKTKYVLKPMLSTCISGEASWSHIQKVVEEDRKNIYRKMGHIKKDDINPDNVNKMKVSVATDVFSKTMANGIEDQLIYGKKNFIISLRNCNCKVFYFNLSSPI